MKTRILTFLAALGLVTTLGLRPALADVGVGYVYVGANSDGGYNQAEDLGKAYVEETVAGVKTHYL